MSSEDKRAALIEALGHAICIADLRERITATVDAIVAIVDERVAELRAPEAEGGGTKSRGGPPRIVHYVPPSPAGIPMPAACGNTDGPSANAVHEWATRWDLVNCEACLRLQPNDAPSEDGEGPEVWVEIDRHGKPAQVSDHKPGHGWEHDPKGRAVRYVPASRLQAAERRIAELESSRDAEIDRRIAEYTAEHDRQCKATQERIAELEERVHAAEDKAEAKMRDTIAAQRDLEQAHRDAKAMWQELADTKRDLEQARAALESLEAKARAMAKQSGVYRDASTDEHARTVHSAQSLAFWSFADEIATLSPARLDVERESAPSAADEEKRRVPSMGDGYDHAAIDEFPLCNGCGKPLRAANYRIADGCPCNTRRGINHGLVPTLTCTCAMCDPAQTGSTRWPEGWVLCDEERTT